MTTFQSIQLRLQPVASNHWNVFIAVLYRMHFLVLKNIGVAETTGYKLTEIWFVK